MPGRCGAACGAKSLLSFKQVLDLAAEHPSESYSNVNGGRRGVTLNESEELPRDQSSTGENLLTEAGLEALLMDGCFVHVDKYTPRVYLCQVREEIAEPKSTCAI